LYKSGENSETIDGNIFSKNEYVFFVQASIPVNETYSLAHKVECRVQIEFKILAEAPSLSIIDREIIFKDPNTFYAFLAAIGGISIVMITSIIIMVWYKCQSRKGRHAGSLYKNTPNTISSDSSRSFRSTLNNSYLNSSKSIKKASTNLDKTIISQWEDKGINGIFYGNDDDVNRVNLEIQDKKDCSKKSSSNYSGNKKRKSNKSISRSLSSSSSTSIPITASSSSRTETPSFSSLGVLASLAVDNTIIEEYPSKEPLSINYETSMNIGEDIPISSSIYKSELVVPQIKYSPNYNDLTGEASFNVDESTEEPKYQQVTQKLNQIINELSKRNLNTFNKTHVLTKIVPNNCTIYSSSSNQTLINKNIECEFFFGNDNFS
jgi:hypothetical protein